MDLEYLLAIFTENKTLRRSKKILRKFLNRKIMKYPVKLKVFIVGDTRQLLPSSFLALPPSALTIPGLSEDKQYFFNTVTQEFRIIGRRNDRKGIKEAYLEGAVHVIGNSHSATGVIELTAIMRSREYCYKPSVCEELIPVLHDLQKKEVVRCYHLFSPKEKKERTYFNCVIRNITADVQGYKWVVNLRRLLCHYILEWMICTTLLL